MAALGVTMGVLVAGAVVVGMRDEVTGVTLVTMVTLELGETVEDGLADVVRFALVDVETTVTVDEGMEEVVVLIYDGPVESLMVVVWAAPVPLMWNGCEYCDKVLLVS
jgi:hypothetical protein